MALSDRRLTGRDVLAKTFVARTKKGYDPIEVDAYLELVAAQIDILHGDLGRLEATAAHAETQTLAPVAPVAPTGPSPEFLAELDELRLANGELGAELAQERSVSEALRAENEQLRAQLAAVAPPPPIAPEAAPAVVVEEPVQVAEAGHDRASEESYELVLRMAHRTAEETIAEAHARADEIVADAELNAAQIAKESDRKAYEAANRAQTELASVNAEIETRHGELRDLQDRAVQKRSELRSFAQDILRLADSGPAHEVGGEEVLDLRNAPSDAQA